MIRLLLSVFAASLLVAPSHAQRTPNADVALGYSSMWVGKGFTFFLNGGSAAVAVNANPWLGLVADFGAHHAEPGVDLTTETYLFGTRFSYRRSDRFTPFAQFLAGGLHASAMTTGFTNASNASAFGGGAGADLGLDSGGRFALRPQLEWFASAPKAIPPVSLASRSASPFASGKSVSSAATAVGSDCRDGKSRALAWRTQIGPCS